MYHHLQRTAWLALVLSVLTAAAGVLAGSGAEAALPVSAQAEAPAFPAERVLPQPEEPAAPAELCLPQENAQASADGTLPAEETETEAAESSETGKAAVVPAEAVMGRRWADAGDEPIPVAKNAAESLSGAIADTMSGENTEAEAPDSDSLSDGTVEHEVLVLPDDPEKSGGTVEREVVCIEHETPSPAGVTYYVGYYREDLKRYYSLPFSRELQDYTYEMAQKYSLPYEVVMGLFGVESGWNPTLYNYNGTCYGLGMLNITYNKSYFAKQGIDMMTPKGNIEASCQVLRDKLVEFDGNMNYALMAYNAGSGGARNMIARGKTSTNYSEAILMYSRNLLTQEEWDALD